jgi:glycosyltransferase involved in cell wall biosynthesis
MRTLTYTHAYDLVVAHFELLPFLPRAVERRLSSSRVPYVIDMDDAMFLRYEGATDRVTRWLLGSKMSQVFADAALVMAGNQFLADRASREAAWVEVVPTVVDTHRYSPGRPPNHGEVFTIGWIGSPSTTAYLEEIAEPLATFPGASNTRLRLVGAAPITLPGVRVESRKWMEDREVADIQTFDVGIMPLPDTLWARGKCGYKLIQYMACGIPVIASPVGVNATLVEHGVNGFLARTSAEWATHLATLSRDPTLRQRMGQAGRAKVEQHYSLHTVAPRVTDLLRRAAIRRSGARDRQSAHAT